MTDMTKKKAVALKYELTKQSAPHVVAKGTGDIADNIIEKAKEHGVKIHEDTALIQLLYQLEINEQIPELIYPIVAEIFVLVYQAEQMAGKENERQS